MKIIAIGRNYIDHAKELNNTLPEKPIFFLKPESALIRKNQPFFYPDFSSNIHYELEIVCKICKVGRNIEKKFAHRYYESIALGVDFTARDLQNECKEKGLPWEIAKAFDGSAPISEFVKLKNKDDINHIDFYLEKNGAKVQEANTDQMIFKMDELIAYVSQFMTLKIGDLIFTGTPAGVGPVRIGDRLTGYLQGKRMIDFYIK